METGIPESVIARYKTNFESDPKNCLARNVCTKFSPEDVLRRREAEETISHAFTHKVETEGKPMTNQKGSGRCWIFAVLNCMRIPLMKELKLEELQLSQSYLFFWDKLERSNYQLQVFEETARNKEPADGRLVQHLLRSPSSEDGGQWDMLVGLIEKYGVMPQACFPDTWNCQNSRKIGKVMDSKMREYCMRLHHLVEKGTDEDTMRMERETMMEEIYRIVSVCIGTPPDTFTFEYYDKDKAYHKIGPIKPVDFYTQYVKPLFNMEDKVVLVNDPRSENPYNRLYTVQYLSNMVNGLVQKYINQPADVLKKLAAESIKNNEAVWFGCDVVKNFSGSSGLLDLTQHDYDLVFGTSVLKQSKAERLVYGDSLMTHAMVLTAFTEEDGRTMKWRVENSWGRR
ncbi:Bleomycin hydrolase [Lamellibrachia satsuma]|nr:Bleomycin hydrolase [Lamellibrachia satsuma]